MATDPYAAPKAHVEDMRAAAEDGQFIADGQGVAAGNGWQWIVTGWELFKQQPGMWILIVVAFFVMAFVIGLIPVLGNIVSNILGPVFAGGILLGCRQLEQGGELEFGHLFAGFREHFGKLVLVGVFYLVALVIIIIVAFSIGGIGFGAMFGGMTDEAGRAVNMAGILTAVLLALALFVPVAMAMWFAPSLIVFNEFGVIDALATSFRACLKNIVPFLIYGVVLFGLAIVASIPFGLGWLALGPTLAASVYASYRDIFYAG